MSLSSLTALMKSNCKVNGNKGDFFDLLEFPDEVIDKIFSYLDPEDRMRMRLNKRLHKIVDESKYSLVALLLIQEYFSDGDGKCVIINDREYPFDFIRRIARNMSIFFLGVHIPPSDDELANRFCNIIMEFRCIRHLAITFPCGEKANEIMTDSFFLDLSKKCESLNLDTNRYERSDIKDISPAVLHNVYKSVCNGSVSILYVCLSDIKRETLHAFLNFLGVSFRNEQVFSNRSIEAYKDFNDDVVEYIVNIFDGFIHLSFIVWGDEDSYDSSFQFRKIEFDVLRNPEALNNAKNGRNLWKRIRMDVYPE